MNNCTRDGLKLAAQSKTMFELHGGQYFFDAKGGFDKAYWDGFADGRILLAREMLKELKIPEEQIEK